MNAAYGVVKPITGPFDELCGGADCSGVGVGASVHRNARPANARNHDSSCGYEVAGEN